jgi:uncharacterized protein (DUF2252 family)
MNIGEATRRYEAWMRRWTTIVDSHLRHKHAQMENDPFLFFRGTFYRWAQLWPEVCADLSAAPRVLAVGDLHLGSFGTWRDAEGRLCWGVDDFDEYYPLPYTYDLVRLAASLKVAIESEHLTVGFQEGCDAIREGYERTLKARGCPIVLAEHDQTLERIGLSDIRNPADFWEHLDALPGVRRWLPKDAKHALEKTLPEPGLDYRVVGREAGMGSLGQPRFVALASWRGGLIAREAKGMVPSACLWLKNPASRRSYYHDAITSAVRSHDPFQQVVGGWLIRRLSPDSNPIEISRLPDKREEDTLLDAMGSEAANVHLGSRRAVKRILKDLGRRKSKWLQSAAKKMAKAIEREWEDYREIVAARKKAARSGRR